jgi:hypothetical protein
VLTYSIDHSTVCPRMCHVVQKHMQKKEPTKQLVLNGVEYSGQLTYNTASRYRQIDLFDPVTGETWARATQSESAREHTVETFGQPVPLVVMKWLVRWTRSFTPAIDGDWVVSDARAVGAGG